MLTPENDLPWPSNMYLEGGDQYRGWFHSSLLVGVALKGAAPYRECATNGWTLDERRPRDVEIAAASESSPRKSSTNTAPTCCACGSSSVDFIEDVRLSDTILNRLIEAYVNLRNTSSAMRSATCTTFDPETDAVPVAELPEIDHWILLRTEELVAKCRAWYDEYAFHKVYRAIYDFATTDLSAV